MTGVESESKRYAGIGIIEAGIAPGLKEGIPKTAHYWANAEVWSMTM